MCVCVRERDRAGVPVHAEQVQEPNLHRERDNVPGGRTTRRTCSQEENRLQSQVGKHQGTRGKATFRASSGKGGSPLFFVFLGPHRVTGAPEVFIK